MPRNSGREPRPPQSVSYFFVEQTQQTDKDQRKETALKTDWKKNSQKKNDELYGKYDFLLMWFNLAM